MLFKGLRTSDARKKFLGAIVIIAFVAFFANVATRYIVLADVDLTAFAIVAAAIIAVFLLAIEMRKKRRGAKRKSSKGARKRRR